MSTSPSRPLGCCSQGYSSYSGFSYTLQLTCKEHAANRDASFDIRPLQKFQTVLAYGGNPPGFSFTDAPDILSSDYQQSRLFKLLLLDHSLWTDLKQESGIRNYVQSVTHVQQNGQIEVTMVGLWDHASREALSNHLVGRRNIHAVIAFPAIFKKDERAKLAFAKAMKMANLTGNPDVTCIEEHRAALNTTLYWEESPAWPMVMVSCTSLSLLLFESVPDIVPGQKGHYRGRLRRHDNCGLYLAKTSSLASSSL